MAGAEQVAGGCFSVGSGSASDRREESGDDVGLEVPMSKARIRQIVRQFPENGLKLLLETPANVRELLQLTGTELIDLIDLERLTRSRTTFVARDFRHVEADIVLQAPVRSSRHRNRVRSVVVYILIEHQSEPDALMILRLLDYTIQVYRHQVRHPRSAQPGRQRRLDPVLPIVLYTGTAAWESLGTMHDLVALGDVFKDVVPSFEPLFLNVGALAQEVIESRGGGLGPVLRLLQQRKSRLAEFQALLARTIERLEGLAEADQARWRDLLTYLHALVYNQRHVAEQPKLQQAILDSVRAVDRREETGQMAKTIAEALIERGARQGKREGRREGRREGEWHARQQTLLRLLGQRFGELPPEVMATIEATRDIERLDAWLDRLATAKRLADVGVGPAA
jgi:predicted transposase YdaD